MRNARVFRLFVSSTFSDFALERNALQAQVFPRLHSLCRERGYRFQPIDLRWGISDEAGQDQQTLRICLGEIARCQHATRRPNFLILLGDRYGWQPLPDEIPAADWTRLLDCLQDHADTDLLQEWYRRDDNRVPTAFALQARHGAYADPSTWAVTEARIVRAVRAGAARAGFEGEAALKYCASATEQEIFHGALESPALAESAVCFARTIRGLPEDARAARYVDVDARGVRDVEAGARSRDLRTRLRAALGPGYREFHADWAGDAITGAHLDRFCDDVHAVLAESVLAEIDGAEVIDVIARDDLEHEHFATERSAGFIGRLEAILSIDAYLNSASPHPFAVIGASGSGKSALMARMRELAAARIPNASVVTRFIGATADSSNIRSLLSGLCRWIERAYGAAEEQLPSDFAALVEKFDSRLALATAETPLIVFLDALDQLSDADQARTLAWLPVELPPHVRLVVSSLPQLEEALTARLPKENRFALAPLSMDEGTRLLDGWLTSAGSTLQTAQKNVVLGGFSKNGLPLYLKLAFETCRTWRSYDPPAPLGDSVPELIDALFERLSAPAGHGALLVERSLAYIGSGKNGLTEDELVDVLSRDDEVYGDFLDRSHSVPPERRLPAIVWSRLHFDLAPYLTTRSADGAAVIAFFHRQLSEVVANAYLAKGRARLRHSALADYFERSPDAGATPNLRRLSELPYQHAHAGDWEALRRTLTEPAFMQRKVDAVGPQPLIDDYQLVDVLADHASHDDAAALRLLQSAVRLSASALSADATTLRSALHGRLLRTASPMLASVVARFEHVPGPWLRLIAPTLAVSGSALVRSFACDEGIASMVFTADERKAVTAGFGSLKLWDLEKGSLVRELGRYEGSGPELLAIGNDRVLVASPEDRVRSCELVGGAIDAVPIDVQGEASRVALSDDGRRAAFVVDGMLTVWDLETGTSIQTMEAPGSFWGFALSSDGGHVATADEGLVRFYDVAAGNEIARFDHPDSRVATIAFIPGTTLAGLAFTYHAPALLDWATGESSHELRQHQDEMFASPVIDAEGRRVVMISRGKDAIGVWDLASGECVRTLGRTSAGDHLHSVTLAISRGGNRALTATETGEMRLWDLNGEPDHLNAEGHARVVRLISIDASRGHVVSGANGME